MIKKIKNIKLSNKKQIILILICIYFMMLILNLLTPLIADDYSYSLNLDGTRINSIIDVLNYQWWHYFNWGGRTISHTIAQLFLLFPKILFSIINPMIYVALIYLIYLHIKRNREEKPLYLILIHLTLWFVLPVFGQTCLWLIGSCNYLWTTVLILLFLWIYRKDNKEDSIFNIFWMFIFGLLAGWTNENTSFGLIIATAGIMLTDKLENKKKKLPKFKCAGLIGNIIGFLILILAPGNYARANEIKDNTFILIKIIKRTIQYTITLTNYLLPLFIALVILISIYIFYKKNINKQVWIYLTSSFFCVYSMVLSPQFPERSWFGVITFMIIAIFDLLYEVTKFNKLYKYVIVDLLIILCFIHIGQFFGTAIDINNLRTTWKYRQEYINKQKKKGNTEITTEVYYSQDKHNPTFGLADLAEDKKIWPNTSIAKYFKIKSIKAKTAE